MMQTTNLMISWTSHTILMKKRRLASTSVTKDRNLPEGNSNLLEDLWSRCADGCTSSGGRAISIFHDAIS